LFAVAVIGGVFAAHAGGEQVDGDARQSSDAQTADLGSEPVDGQSTGHKSEGLEGALIDERGVASYVGVQWASCSSATAS
jgi:hypothetical protein